MGGWGDGEGVRACRDDGGIVGAPALLSADGADPALLLDHQRPLQPVPHGAVPPCGRSKLRLQRGEHWEWDHWKQEKWGERRAKGEHWG